MRRGAGQPRREEIAQADVRVIVRQLSFERSSLSLFSNNGLIPIFQDVREFCFVPRAAASIGGDGGLHRWRRWEEWLSSSGRPGASEEEIDEKKNRRSPRKCSPPPATSCGSPLFRPMP